MHSAFILFSISPFSPEFQLPLICPVSILIHSENQFYLFLIGIQSNSQRSSHSWDNTAFSEAKRNKSCPADLLQANSVSKRAALGFRTDPDKDTKYQSYLTSSGTGLEVLRGWDWKLALMNLQPKGLNSTADSSFSCQEFLLGPGVEMG